MFIKSKAKYLVKVMVNIGLILGCATDEEAFVELKELDTQSMMALKEASEKGESAYMNFMKGVMPTIITEHNLYREEGKLMSNAEATDLIFSKLDLTTKVVSEYMEQAFRISGAGAGEANKKPGM